MAVRGLSHPNSRGFRGFRGRGPLSPRPPPRCSIVLFLGRYIYPLDSSTWIEYWPTADAACPACPAFLANLDEFAEDIFLNGCENS